MLAAAMQWPRLRRLTCITGCHRQSTAGDGPVQVVIHTGFAYDDDAGADKSIANAAASA
jgi:hypothetical protein